MNTKKSSIWLNRLIEPIVGGKITYELRYFRQRKKWPNLKHPKDLSEHLLADMFSDAFLQYSIYADKVKVRDYVSAKGLGNCLLKHYGVWDRPEDIDIDILPEKFILKANNGSGGHVICKDKSSFDREKAVRILNDSIRRGLNNIEPHYRNIEPKVFCEELIDTGTDDWPTDYKFTCIHGEIYDVFVAVDRRVDTKYCTFDTNWNVLPYTKKEYLPKDLPQAPEHLSEMINIAKILSKDFKFVRVDLYEYRNQVYFSELTFSPWGGLMYSYTDEAIKYLGSKY